MNKSAATAGMADRGVIRLRSENYKVQHPPAPGGRSFRGKGAEPNHN